MEGSSTVDMLKKVQEIDKAKVVSLIYPPGIPIDQSDVDALYDVLDEIGFTNKIDLILYSYGGDADAAYKIARIFRKFCKHFSVIIPSEAKSAATLITFGADKILMGPVSELGPVDPSVSHPMLPGVVVPARATLKFIEDYISIISKIPGSSKLPLIPLDPAHIGFCRLAIDSAKEYGELLLSRYNMKGRSKTDIKRVNDKLTGGYASHSFVIDLDEAREIGLNVEEMSKKLSNIVWELFRKYGEELKTFKEEEKVQVILETEKRRSDIIKVTPKRLLL